MKVINVALTIKPETRAAYEEFIAELVEGSRAEAGNVSYGHYKLIGAENDYEIIEHWADAEAVETHNATPHLQSFLAHVGEYLAKDPEILRFDYEA